MKNVYVKDGEKFFPFNSEQLNVMDQLPVGVYTIAQTWQGYIIKQTDDFAIPEKIYGDLWLLAPRILTTYTDRSNSTGILLTGDKGTGKSLLAKYVSYLGAQKGMITIIVNESLCDDKFNTLIQSINQPTILIFDEFEKVYGFHEQEKLLTLFDGVYSQKKLFILTCNDIDDIDHHMINRPGRLYYAINFKGISGNFAQEYCNDNLQNKELITSVIEYVESSGNCSFDMLQSLVEEMNRYNETVQQALKLLNIYTEDIED
jgi:predicted AAA+ superfamily ATPase